MFLAIVFEDIKFALLFVFFIAIAWLLAEFKGMKDELKERLGINNEVLKFRMQAYERLTLLVERLAFKQLISRVESAGLSVIDFQLHLLQTINEEYQYNVSQQIYISTPMWKAISNLKDQHIYIINQLAAALPSQSAATTLSKKLLEYEASSNSNICTVVMEALQFEAKELF